MKTNVPLRDRGDRRNARRASLRRRCLVAAPLTSLAVMGTSLAQPAGEPLQLQIENQRVRLEALHRRLLEQEGALRETRGALEAQRREIEAQLGLVRGRGPSDAPGAPAAVAQAAPSNPPTSPAGGPVGQAPNPKDQRPIDVAPIFQQPGVLTARGKLLIEPSLQYAHSNDNRVAVLGYSVLNVVLIGALDIRRVTRDTWTGAVTTRYGLSNRSELELRLPYVYRHDQTVTRPATNTGSTSDEFFEASGKHIGDFEMTGRMQLNEGGGDKPYYVGSLRVKSRTGLSPFNLRTDASTNLQTELPTGSGFFGIQPGVTVLIPSDPAVFFGGMSYMYNIARDPGGGVGRVTPGNIFGFNMGMGLALNERATFSIGYDHAVVGKTHQTNPDAATVRLGQSTTAQLGTLLFGVSYRLNQNRTINLSLGLGVTREAPDLQLTLRMPTLF